MSSAKTKKTAVAKKPPKKQPQTAIQAYKSNLPQPRAAWNLVFNEPLADAIVQDVRDGMPYSLSANLHRVPQSTVATWLQKGEEDPDGPYAAFAADIRQAQAEFVREAVRGIKDAGFTEAKQWTALMTLLERIYPDHFKRPSEKGDININVGVRVEERLHSLHKEGVIEYTGG